jgi:hypothetical protein
MRRFPEIERWQAVIARSEHKDFLTLRVVPTASTQVSDLVERVAEAAKDAIRLSLVVETTTRELLSEGAPPIEDTRTWE